MPPTLIERRAFEPGTTGWTATDLDDPEIERQWFAGRYEIVEGVLTQMPPAYFAGGEGLINLLYLLKDFTRSQHISARFATEVDIVVSELRVARSDAAMLSPRDSRRQDAAARRAGKIDLKRTRIYVPPTLVIESISPGHEQHDLETKHRWYREFGVPHYWILDAFRESLQCLSLHSGQYEVDASGKKKAVVKPSLFPNLHVRLAEVFSV